MLGVLNLTDEDGSYGGSSSGSGKLDNKVRDFRPLECVGESMARHDHVALQFREQSRENHVPRPVPEIF
jgi:hypothetical protein